MTISKPISVSIICATAALQACSYDFAPDIAKCNAMTDVNLILEGQFRKPSKQDAKFEAISEQLGTSQKDKIIYSFKVSKLHKGASGIINNKTGKHIPPSSIPIRGDVADKSVIGKKAVICYGGKPRKIKAIHMAK